MKRKNNIKGNKYAPSSKYFCECFHCSAAWTSLHSTDQKEIPVWWMVLLIWQKRPPLFTDSTKQNERKMRASLKCHSDYFHIFFLNRLIMRMPAFCVHQQGLKTLKVLEAAVWVSVESESGFSWAFSGFSSLYSWAKYSHLRELNLQA